MSKVASFRFTGYETDFLLITTLPTNLLSGGSASCSKWEERPQLPFSQEDTPWIRQSVNIIRGKLENYHPAGCESILLTLTDSTHFSEWISMQSNSIALFL